MGHPKDAYVVTVTEVEDDYRERSVLRVTRFGKSVLERYDGGEPEDNSFGRDWSWVEGALREAYALGLADGQAAATPSETEGDG
jgi:hypothetical protein